MPERHPAVRQIYLSAAVVAFAASFAPLWVPDPDDTTSDLGTYSLWTVLPVDGGGAALLGVMLVMALVGVGVAAASDPTLGPRGLPIGLLVMAVIAMLVVLAKPNTGEPPPSFGPGAGLLFGTSVGLAITAVADLWLSFRAPARSGS